jgi:hypothetical protein
VLMRLRDGSVVCTEQVFFSDRGIVEDDFE